MGFSAILVVAAGLAMDAFAVCLGIGTTRRASRPRPVFRLSFHMGLFQGLMTLVGWLAGATIAPLIHSVAHWIALALLAYVGLNMIRSGLSLDEEAHSVDPSRGRTLIMLCVACSIDAMAVGLSLGMLKTDILMNSAVIGVVTVGFSLAGLLAGHRLGGTFGKRMEILGGLLLNGIGIRLLLAHL